MSGDNLRDSIVLEHVKKSFGKHQVLKDINGTIAEGSTIGILGRNGEGKTTLFKIMLDILAADEGKINVLNHAPDGSSRIRTIAGYVPERPVFHSFMTVDDVFKFRTRLFPNWHHALMNETARSLDLDLSTLIKGASKGTLAKTAWICATAHRPKVLILDEPTSGLDPIVRDALLSQCVREQSSEGKTIIVASHHLEEWLNLLDEIWVMSGGVIAGKYKLQDLRENAFRITGQVKECIIASRPFDRRRIQNRRPGAMAHHRSNHARTNSKFVDPGSNGCSTIAARISLEIIVTNGGYHRCSLMLSV